MRLTRKLEPPYERVAGKDYVYTNETRLTPSFASVEQKLGKIEDILENFNIETLEELDYLLWYAKKIKDTENELGVDVDSLFSLFKALKNGIYGSMYGGKPDDKINKIIYIKPNSLKLCLHTDKPCFCYVWGWPGPDTSTYYLKDYGVSWALTKEELL